MWKLILALAAFTVVEGQQGQQCQNEWNSQRQCIKDQQSQYAPPDMTDRERQTLKEAIRNCYRQARCLVDDSHPFPNEREEQARRQCAAEFTRQYRQDMQNCIQRTFPDFQMPSGNDRNRNWGQDMVAMKQNPCKPQQQNDQQAFGRCMGQAFQNTGVGKHISNGQRSNRPDPCEVRYQCYQKSNYHENCYNRQNEVRKALCACVQNQNSVPVARYKSNYQSCMQRANVNVDSNNDFFYKTMDRIQDAYCKETKDPCGGYSGRQQAWAKSNNRGGGQGQGRGGNSGQNNGGRWQGQNNQNNQGQWQNQQGNQGQWQNQQGNQGSNSQSNTDLSAYDLSSVGAGNSDGFPSIGSVMSGGGTSPNVVGGGMPDLSSMVGSNNLGMNPGLFSPDMSGALGGLTGGNTGAGGLGNALGGGGGIGSLFSGLTGGGGAGGLSGLTSGLGNAGGAGGGLSGLTSMFGGANGFDMSSLMSGFPGKRKK